MPLSISIEELHATTGEHVRRAAASRTPAVITDRGEPIAVLANTAPVRVRRRRRTLLPEFAALMECAPGEDVVSDLDAVRGER